jgi:hypothetical protein
MGRLQNMLCFTLPAGNMVWKFVHNPNRPLLSSSDGIIVKISIGQRPVLKLSIAFLRHVRYLLSTCLEVVDCFLSLMLPLDASTRALETHIDTV